jgi:integrase
MKTKSGDRRIFRRSGYVTIDDAETALDAVRNLLALAEDAEDLDKISEMLDSLERHEDLPSPDKIRQQLSTSQPLNNKGTIGEWLEFWLKERKKDLERGDLVEKTWHGYEGHCRQYLVPKIGDIRRDRFFYENVVEMFNKIHDDNDLIIANNEDRQVLIAQAKAAPYKSTLKRQLYEQVYALPPFQRPVGKPGQHAILRTLRAAINDGLRNGKFTHNPGALYKIKGAKTKPLVWTKARERHWRATGNRPGSVMVWRPDHVGIFLDHVIGHWLEALWHLFVKRGPRRGEAVAAPWTAYDEDEATLDILTQIVESPLGLVERPPKTESGVRSVPLDDETNELIVTLGERQSRRKKDLGDSWVESGRIFTMQDGAALRPGYVNDEFNRLIAETHLPPIRVHDLRHVAATLMLLGGTDLKVVQAILGHATFAITAEIYTSVLEEALRDSAKRVLDVIPPRARPSKPFGHASGTQPAPNLMRGGDTD